MIEVYKTVDVSRLGPWLEGGVREHLRPDVSRYARGRLRVWLWQEPSLTSPTTIRPGLELSEGYRKRLREIIEWDFDFCLVTYSGDEEAIGIGAHRDASYADYEARSLHVTGECLFRYWANREGFGYSPDTGKFPESGPASHELLLLPGQVTRFNCKNLHAAEPGVKRWNLNFWKAKGPRRETGN